MELKLKELEKELKRNIGVRCKDHSEFCFVCINYKALDTLKETFNIYEKHIRKNS